MSWLVDDWKQAWRWSSVRLHAAVLMVAAVYQVAPVLDPSIAGMLPGHVQSLAIGVYALGSIVLRVTKLKSGG